jgi:hypothetical protein
MRLAIKKEFFNTIGSRQSFAALVMNVRFQPPHRNSPMPATSV